MCLLCSHPNGCIFKYFESDLINVLNITLLCDINGISEMMINLFTPINDHYQAGWMGMEHITRCKILKLYAAGHGQD